MKKEKIKKKANKKDYSSFKTFNINKNKEHPPPEILARFIRHEKAYIRIGKNGINKGVIEAIKSSIEREGAVKVQILKNCPIESPIEVFSNLAKQTNTLLWRKTGRTGIFISKKH